MNAPYRFVSVCACNTVAGIQIHGVMNTPEVLVGICTLAPSLDCMLNVTVSVSVPFCLCITVTAGGFAAKS